MLLGVKSKCFVLPLWLDQDEREEALSNLKKVEEKYNELKVVVELFPHFIDSPKTKVDY